MSEVSINVGIDFGTHQSKVCVQIQEGQTKRYEFVPFNPRVKTIDSALFPSLVHVLPDGRFHIGAFEGKRDKTYSFFKIASAEDEDFHADLATTVDRYTKQEFLPYHPEQLSVLYVAGLILKVRQHVNSTVLEPPEESSKPAFLRRLYAAPVKKKTGVWRYRMGVPTEYHSSANQKRKRKFEQILILAILIADTYGESFWEKTMAEIMSTLERMHKALLKELGFDLVNRIDIDQWKAFLADNRASVFPETAAGLIFLVKTNKLVPDRYYMAMDIGGGSTDISFFKAEYNGTFTYLASQSVMLAANDVALDMGVEKDFLHVRESVSNLYKTPGIERRDDYYRSFKKLGNGLNDASYKMFNGQVWSRAEYSATHLYQDSQCYLYGGGSMLPTSEPNPEKYLRRITLHDQGSKASLTSTVLYAEVTPIENLTINETVVNPGWEAQIRVLIVSLGLSLSLPDDQMVDYVVENFSRPNAQGVNLSNMFDFPTAKWV